MLGLRVGAMSTASFHIPPGVARGPTPTRCVLESYFTKLHRMQGTTPISKVKVKIFLLEFNITFFCSNPNPTMLGRALSPFIMFL